MLIAVRETCVLLISSHHIQSRDRCHCVFETEKLQSIGVLLSSFVVIGGLSRCFIAIYLDVIGFIGVFFFFFVSLLFISPLFLCGCDVMEVLNERNVIP